jgi:Sulfatase
MEHMKAATSEPDYRRGFWLAATLAMLFLVGSAVQSVATLLFRIRGDVMHAATGSIFGGYIGRETTYFVAAQLLLHFCFGVAVWALACATAVAWPRLRAQFGQLVVGWFCLLVAAAIAYNITWFPRTGLGAYYHGPASVQIGPLMAGQVFYLAVVALAIFVLLAAARTQLGRLRFGPFSRSLAIVLAIAVLGFASAFAVSHRTPRAGSRGGQPHIILLGIDSLRLEQLKRFGGTGVTPNLDEFLTEADIVRDVTTPVPRTFPSWAAILSGRSPGKTGVRFNLAPRDLTRVSPTLCDVLREAGYRTIYSTDEVRFANIDESYGFDQVVTPPIGAADFVLGNYNELPLASVIVNTRLGQWLFPYSYGNRGAATLFQPETFLTRLDREVSFDDGPTLLITHLTVSHWPYFLSDSPFGVSEKKYPNDRPLYRIGVRAADAMFGEVVAMLKRKGALDNAIVVILSDHGEALALPDDTMISNKSKIDGLRAPIIAMDTGHGQSVLSPVQFQLLLGFRTFGDRAGFEVSGRDIPGAATVEDIAPTLLDLAGIPGDPLSTTGRSFATVLRGESGADRVSNPDRVRFTETDLQVLPDTEGGVDEAATAQQNSKFFEVSPTTGRMSVRKNFMPLLLAFKERAAFTDSLFLAALPAGPDAHQYILIDRASGNGRVLMGPPEAARSAERALWDAMAAEYGDELKPPMTVTREDWAAIGRGWDKFFITRTERAKAAAVAQ